MDDLTANKRVLMTAASSIDYDALTQDAMRGMVRTVLVQIAKGGLPGEHHFYIAFDTQAPGVVMSRRLKEKYPEEMMVVLQHRFWDLAVTDEGFEVKLTFDGIPERLYIPFESLRVFFDPSVRFTLQFGEPGANADEPRDASGARRKMDAGEAGSRQGADRRPQRSRSRARADNGQDVAEPQQPAQPPVPAPAPAAASNQPVAFAPRPVPVAPTPPAATEDAGGQPPGGAKVFSLDQFRKK